MWLLERGRISLGKDSEKDTSRNVQVGLLYIKGLSKELRRTHGAHGEDSFFNPSSMLCQLQCSPKHPEKKNETICVIYQINCEGVSKDSGCMNTYIGETGRTLKLGPQNIGSLALGPQRCHNTCTSRGDRSTRSL